MLSKEYVDWDSNPGLDLGFLELMEVLIYNDLQT